MHVCRTILHSIVSLTCLAAATGSAFAVSPRFVNPDTLNTNNPFVLTALSPNFPYAIDGFSGGVEGLFLYKINNQLPTLRPALWRTQPGRVIAFELQNQLPCTPSSDPGNPNRMRPDQTNVHVHGLVVSPNLKTSAGSYGDNAMLVVDSVNKGCLTAVGPMTMGIHPHETGGTAAYRIKLPEDHPYGLSWYHPHVHEVAGYQVGSGMSGLISIGNVWSYAYARYSSADIGAASEQMGSSQARRQTEQVLRQHTKELHLMLKDLQVNQTQAVPLRYKYNTQLDVALCGTSPAPNGVCSNATGDAKWLFMVNGQVFPTITINRGDRHVWRMANVGATVSYKLRLRVTAPAAASGTIIPMQVLASDGVAFQQLKANANWQKSVTMMPSARAEVHIDPLHICRVLAGRSDNDRSPCTMAQDVEAVLETNGIKTGADAWPDAGLAQVKIKAIPQYVAANDPGPMGVSTVRDAGTFNQTALAGAASTPACANPSSILPTQYRLIGVKNETRGTTEFFGMATQATPGELNAAGKPRDTTLAASSYKAFDANRVDLCIGADIKNKYSERWVIKNDAGEIHNFHVHQAKFKVLDYDDTVPLLVPMRTGKDVLHDNFPINQGQWVMVQVTFDHKEQVGKYMYHCHILEHEDKGMMSVIQVVDTSSPTAMTTPSPVIPSTVLAASTKPLGLSSGRSQKPSKLQTGSRTASAAAPRMMATASISNSIKAADDALARYRASVPPWMAQSLCTSPNANTN